MKSQKSAKKLLTKKAVTKAVTIVVLVILILIASVGTVVYFKFDVTQKSPNKSSSTSGSSSGNGNSTSNATIALPSNTTLTVSSDDGESVSLSAAQILAMPSASGLGGYTQHGDGDYYYTGTYVGVPVIYLCNLVGGVCKSSLVEEKCSDGFKAYLSYQQVYNASQGFSGELYNPATDAKQNATQQMTLILAYWFSNSTYSGVLPCDYGLRVMAVGSQGLVSWGSYSGYWITSLQVINAPSTPLKFNTCSSSGTAQTSFEAGENIYFAASGLSASTTYSVYVVPHQASWKAGASIPARISGTATSIASDGAGHVALTSIYGDAAAGQYDVIVTTNNGGQIDENDLIIIVVVSTATPTPTSSPTVTSTPTPTLTLPSPSPTPTPTATPTPTPVPTLIPSSTPTSSPASTPTPSSTPTPTPAPTPALTFPSGQIFTITSDDGQSLSFSAAQILAMPSASGLGGYTQHNEGDFYYTGTYVGVPVIYLCNLVGGLTQFSSIQEYCSDGYTTTLTYQEVYNATQGFTGSLYNPNNPAGAAPQNPTQTMTLILAYEFSNSSYSGNLPDGQGNFRIMAVGPEGLVSWGTYSGYEITSLAISVSPGALGLPSLTFNTCNSAGTSQSSFNSGSNVYFSATGLSASTTFKIYVVPHQSAWTVGMPIPTATSTTTLSTGSSGNIAAASILNNAQSGQYDVLVKTVNANDGAYDSQDLLIINVVSTPGPGLTISAFGSLVALGCFAVFITYVAVKRKTNIWRFSTAKDAFSLRSAAKVIKNVNGDE